MFVAIVTVSISGLALGAGLDQATKDYLEGIWLVGRLPEKGPCISHWYDGETQLEFEFRKTDGRLLVFEPRDLFTAISIATIERTGDLLWVQLQTRDGRLVPFDHIRLLPPDRIELQEDRDPSSIEVSPKMAYRCGSPDLTVNDSMTMDGLSVATPSLTGSQAFPEVEPSVSDRDLCQGRELDPSKAFHKRWLQFELLGPVHYWVFGWAFWPERKLAFDFVRSVHQIDAHTLKLEMQEHLPGGGGWDAAESRGKTYQLTIIDEGARIEIPELAATFARCAPDEPGSLGAHRW